MSGELEAMRASPAGHPSARATRTSAASVVRPLVARCRYESASELSKAKSAAPTEPSCAAAAMECKVRGMDRPLSTKLTPKRHARSTSSLSASRLRLPSSACTSSKTSSGGVSGLMSASPSAKRTATSRGTPTAPALASSKGGSCAPIERIPVLRCVANKAMSASPSSKLYQSLGPFQAACMRAARTVFPYPGPATIETTSVPGWRRRSSCGRSIQRGRICGGRSFSRWTNTSPMFCRLCWRAFGPPAKRELPRCGSGGSSPATVLGTTLTLRQRQLQATNRLQVVVEPGQPAAVNVGFPNRPLGQMTPRGVRVELHGNPVVLERMEHLVRFHDRHAHVVDIAKDERRRAYVFEG